MTGAAPDLAMSEPPHGTILYWPTTPDEPNVAAVRDDTAHGADAQRHWWILGDLGDEGEPLTWGELYAWSWQYGADLLAAQAYRSLDVLAGAVDWDRLAAPTGRHPVPGAAPGVSALGSRAARAETPR